MIFSKRTSNLEGTFIDSHKKKFSSYNSASILQTTKHLINENFEIQDASARGYKTNISRAECGAGIVDEIIKIVGNISDSFDQDL